MPLSVPRILTAHPVSELAGPRVPERRGGSPALGVWGHCPRRDHSGGFRLLVSTANGSPCNTFEGRGAWGTPPVAGPGFREVCGLPVASDNALGLDRWESLTFETRSLRHVSLKILGRGGV